MKLLGGSPLPYDESLIIDSSTSNIKVSESPIVIDQTLPQKDVEEGEIIEGGF